MNSGRQRLGAPLRSWGWLALLAAAACVLACGPARSSSLPAALLGRWDYVGSSGGLDGRGLGDAATGFVEIGADGTLARYADDGTLVETKRFRAVRGKTLFSADEQWLLTYEVASEGLPDSSEPAELPADALLLSADGRTLVISENVYDGFSRSYERAR